MKKLDKDIKVSLFVSIMLTIFFPIGVVFIVFGAIKSIVPLLVLGILLVVFGFYGSPISWSNYSKKKSLRVVLRLILNENLYSVEELSEQTNKRKREIVSMINTLILKEYLTGYKFKGEILELNTNKKQSAKVTRKQKCDVCGGMMKFDGVHFVCEYCGNVTKEK